MAPRMIRSCTGCGRPEFAHRVVCLDGEFVVQSAVQQSHGGARVLHSALREPWRPPTIRREGTAEELTGWVPGGGMGGCPIHNPVCS